MGFKCGIVGLPNVGKSTLFNALSNARAQVENFPFCTIEPNIGVVPVPDERLLRLSELVDSQKTTPAFIEIVDIAGLVRGASEGKGRGNAFLSHIREVDLILHVVRCFEDEGVVHVEGGLDAIRDIKIIEDELVIKDLETIERREQRLSTQAKSGDRAIGAELEFVTGLMGFLEGGGRAINYPVEGKEELTAYRDLFLLTAKPVVYVCNIAEGDLPHGAENEEVGRVAQYARGNGSDTIVICAEIEAEIAELDEDERRLFLEELGLEGSGLDRLIRTAYHRLGLITFFTHNPKELRAWTLKTGAKAPSAGGLIHTDFERGFIRAETIKYQDFLECGSEQAAREAGRMRSEGKDYVVEDGDVILFRFNV